MSKSSKHGRRSLAALVAGVAFGISSVVGLSSQASAAYKNFTYGGCLYRVSTFQDWGKAAASNHDLPSSCGNLTISLTYGPAGVPTWESRKGPTATDYLKTVAGYYTPYAAKGKAGGSGWGYVVH